MKAQELRIGNYIKHKDHTLIEVDHTEITEIYFNSISYNPIPITEEWLIKFGFNKREYISKDFCSGCDFALRKNDFVIIYEEDFSLELVSKEGDIAITPDLDRFRYVHQLQNLYFALTGEELTIKN